MRTLVLAGTHEAQMIARAASRIHGMSVTVSLARSQRRPTPFGWPVRIGGWGGEDAFSTWLEREGIEAVIDATHPFATEMSHRAARVTKALGIDHIQMLRPSWIPTEHDDWAFLNDEAEAPEHVPEGAVVLVATGRRRMDALHDLPGRTLIVRVKEPGLAPESLPNAHFRFDPGPFSVEAEVDLFRRLGITWVLARNSGGTGSWPKIEAARELGLPVAMVRRPRQPDCDRVTTVAQAIAWMRRRE